MKTKIKCLDQIEFDPERFMPYLSGNELDNIFSKESGLHPGTNYMIAGPPGVAKSTILLKYAPSPAPPINRQKKHKINLPKNRIRVLL